MGIRIVEGQDVAAQMMKEAERSTRALRRVHVAAAHAARDTAVEMAPFKEGVLEGGIELDEEIGAGGRKVFQISAHAEKGDYNYAPWAHEAHYNLGPGSRAKESQGAHKVGRKFLTRALRWLIDEWDLYRKAADAVKRK